MSQQTGIISTQTITRMKKTRLAPTPSGFLHLGNVLSFSITAGLAKRAGAEILLRIDDLDRSRMRREYLRDIFETLEFLEITWDTGPRNEADFLENWTQLNRMELYQQALRVLAASDSVYACSCSRKDISLHLSGQGQCNCLEKQIPLESPNVCWRWLPEMPGIIPFSNLENDLKAYPVPTSAKHFVVRKRDGIPSYQLASVIDDNLYEIDLVVRGADLIDSTLMQLVLSRHMQHSVFPNACFHHHELLTNKSGEKLSKSAGSTSIQFLRQNGMQASSIFEMISSMLNLKFKATNWQNLFDFWLEHNAQK